MSHIRFRGGDVAHSSGSKASTIGPASGPATHRMPAQPGDIATHNGTT